MYLTSPMISCAMSPMPRSASRSVACCIGGSRRHWKSLYADDLDPVSAQIAAQYEQAGSFEQALPYYQRAGDVAAGVYANDDAIELMTRGLALLPHIPPGAKRDGQELGMQLALATLYRIAKGWTSPEEERVMNRLMVLSDKVGNEEQRISTLFGLQTLYVVQARYEKVERTYDEAERLYLQYARHTAATVRSNQLGGRQMADGPDRGIQRVV